MDEKFNQYMKDHYPNLEPCLDCYYYRTLSNGVPYVRRARRYLATQSCPACHYFIETGELRDEVAYDGKCKHFKPRTTTIKEERK